MISDIYAFAKALSQDLRNAGEEQWSSALDQAMSISGMSGEVLGEIRFQLRKLRRTKIPQQLHLEDRVNKALQYFDTILGPWPEEP
jgi:hypothetical protein